MELNQVQASSPEPMKTHDAAQKQMEHNTDQVAKEQSSPNGADKVELSTEAQWLQSKEARESEQKDYQASQEIIEKQTGEENVTEKVQEAKSKRAEEVHEKKIDRKYEAKSHEVNEERYGNKQTNAYGYTKQQDTGALTGNNIDAVA